MKKLCQAYFVEVIWLNEGYIPTMDEYMSNALISTCCPALIILSFVSMGDMVTQEAFEWDSKVPKIVKAASTITRLMDDIVSNEVHKRLVQHCNSIIGL